MKVSTHSILYNNEIKKGYFLMGFECNTLKKAEPGQFITMSVDGIEANIPLRRPFTIYKINNSTVEILYKLVGKGTKLFSTLKPGDSINILGPLGNSFRMFENSKIILLGRGVGLASLACLGDSLKKLGCDITVIASFKDESSNIIDDYIKSFSNDIIVVEDEDGTSSCDNVRKIIEGINPDVIYSCGSKRLLRMLQKMKYKSYVTLEERMGCGLGACLTCAIKTPSGYKRVCKDGPCFDVMEVII
jgi:dihydroorotate dehydrogenase electron transfer subunit